MKDDTSTVTSEKIRGNNFLYTLFSFFIFYYLMPLEVSKENRMLKQIWGPAPHEHVQRKGIWGLKQKLSCIEANQNYLKSEWKPRLLNAKSIHSFYHTQCISSFISRCTNKVKIALSANRIN